MNRTSTLASAAVVAILVSACSSTPSTTASKPAAEAPKVESAAASKPSPSVATTDPRKDPNSPLAARSIYFDYDDFSVKADYRSVIEAHGRFLSKNTKLQVRLEGNADERGSKEYNLALGQKRAETVAKALMLLGISNDGVEAVSFGEEKPKATGHEEASWTQNRRVDIIYSDEK